MGTNGLRFAAILCCLAGMTAGCRAPSSSGVPLQSVSDTHDEYDGWLFKKLTGQGDPPDSPPPKRPPETPKGDVTGMGAGSGSASAQQISDEERYEQWLQRKIAGLERPPHPESNEQSIAAAQQEAGAYKASQPANQGPDVGTSLSQKIEEDKDNSFEWSQLEPQNVWKRIKKACGYGPNEAFAQATFREGETLYREKRYDEAASKFAVAADRWPDSTLEEDSMFYQAESYFFADRYGKAHDAFLLLFKKFPNTRYLDTAVSRQYAIGQYWEQMYQAHPHWPVTPNFSDKSLPWFDTAGNAENAYTAVQVNDPTGPLADEALWRKGSFFFTRGYFEEAAHNFDTLRREYPKSRHQVAAHVLDLQAKREMYEGPYYDGTPLKDAEQIASQALKQFPGKLGDERARIVEAKAQMREQRAEREFAAGQFWEKKRAFGSARLYYRDLLNEYPGTHVASMAQERLEAIKNEPDNPPKPFQWLAKIFDRDRR